MNKTQRKLKLLPKESELSCLPVPIKKRRKGTVSGVLQQTRQRKFKKKESSYLKETELSRPTSFCKKKKKRNG
jgi:hypothetical protein